MKKISLDWIWIVGLTSFLLFADLWSKSWAQSTFMTPWRPPDFPWFSFNYSENPGIAFGLPLGGPLLMLLSIALIGGFIGYGVLHLDLRPISAKLGVSLVLAGALGNTIDRFSLGIVRDFISVGPWPLFNLADTWIVLGLVALLSALYPSFTSSR